MKKSIRNLSTVTTIGLDIAKNVFQVHGVDAAGAVVVAKSIRRAKYWPSSLRCRRVWWGRGVQFGAPLGARADRFGPLRKRTYHEQ
jgi:hypothetical protein